jgi:ubiquinone biosynthesis protein
MAFQIFRLSFPLVSQRKRYREIISTFIRHGFSSELTKFQINNSIFPLSRTKKNQFSAITPAEHFRLALEELGPTFIKIGQILTTRPDLLGAEYIRELTKLQDSVSPGPWENVYCLLVEELGGRPEEVFSFIDPVPLAAASLAQVHHATLKTGEDVVVKIQRPGITSIIDMDLEILKSVAALVQHATSWGEANKPQEIVEEFAFTLRNELDYFREGHNAERFKKNFKDDERIHIPKIYWEYTTKTILVMEQLVGIKIDDIQGLDSAGYDRKKIALNAVSIMVKEILEDGFYHADPHGGNLVVLSGGVIGAMDFGMVGELHDRSRHFLIRLYICVIALDADGMVHELTNMNAIGVGVDRTQLIHDLERMLNKYAGLKLKEFRLQEILEDFLIVATRYNIIIPADLWLLGKTMVMTEGLGVKLDPEFDIFSASKPIVKQLEWRLLSPGKSWSKSLLIWGADCGDLFASLPRASRRLLEKIEQDEPFRVRVDDANKLMASLSKLVNRLVVSIIIASLCISLGILIATTTDGSPLQFLIVAGFLVVVCLSVWLLVSILKRL